ncbi:MAG: phosphoglycolate phosphatase [Alphaproteobacteria bacterium]|nr:phosphoglycolate phosphatase [Alphaproteobacteria bacterium]
MRDMTIVFDLDGTLIDTAPDLVDATNHVLAALKLSAVPETDLRNWISFGARRMITEALFHHGQTLTDPQVDDLLAQFLDYYEANIANRSRPYPGIVDAIDQLLDQGATLAVCTNKREALSLSLLNELDLTSRFAAIAGRDTFPVFKPDPEHLLGTIRLANGDPARAIMVGDSATDIATAKAARIPVIAVSFGYTDVPAAQLGANALIDCHTTLLQAIAQLRQDSAVASKPAI